MQVVLVMFRSDGERRSFSLPKDVTLIGRREDCDLRIPLREVSRKHCRLIKEAEMLRLEDLGSSNGTYHNGVRVQESVIAPGDVLQIGSVAFVVQVDGVPADDQVQPPFAPEAAGQEGVVPEVPAAGATAADQDIIDFDPSAIMQDAPAAPRHDDIVDLGAVDEAPHPPPPPPGKKR